MNRLPFGSFHATHFDPQHVQQWHSYLHQPQLYPYNHYHPPQAYPYNHYHPPQAYPSNHYHQPQNTEPCTKEETRETEDLQDPLLSKEAIEIFEFSETYSKEQQQDTEDREENEAERNQHDANTIMNLATSLYHDGMEAPVTSLVLLSSPTTTQQEPSSNRILTQQHLINSAYLTSCDSQYQEENQVPLVMWPVLPFRL